jgi:glycosyltransferase involved in cell wall biosynthesis
MKMFRAKTIVDVHGVLPEEMLFVGKPIRAAIWQLVERATVRNPGLLIVVTQKMAQHFLKKYPGAVDPSRIMVLPNFDSCGRRNQKILRPSMESGKLQFIYAGGVHKYQNIDLMLETLKHLADFRQDWRAGIYVPPEAIREVQAKVNLFECGSYVEVASLTHDEVIAKYPTMDIGFVLRKASLLNEVAMPTKLVEYITYGVVPVVLSPDIGDFVQYGYKYLTLQDLFDDRKLDYASLEAMRASNFQTLASIYASTLEARKRLASWSGNLVWDHFDRAAMKGPRS